MIFVMPHKTVKMRCVIWQLNVMWFWSLVLLIHQIQTRLRELAERMGKHAYLVDNADELEQAWFDEISQSWGDSWCICT